MRILDAANEADLAILKTKCVDADLPVGPQFLLDLRAAVEDANGLGLAAPQLGVNVRIFAARIDGLIKIFINPTNIKLTGPRMGYRDGCLSIPGVVYYTARNQFISFDYTNPNGTPGRVKYRGLEARICQHEIDHLDGILISDKGSKVI